MNNPANEHLEIADIPDWLIQRVCLTVRNNFQHWWRAMEVSQGGWEGWAQVELFNALNLAATAQIAGAVLSRELRVWPAPSTDRVDICINWGPGLDANGGARRFWPIELKCCTVFQAQEQGRFRDAFQEDCQRVEQQPAAAFLESSSYAIGFTRALWDTEHFNAIDERHFIRVVPEELDAMAEQTIYVIWAKFDHP